MESIVYTVEETAQILKIGRTAVFGLIKDSELQSIKIGGSRRVPEQAIRDYVDHLMEA